MKNIKLIFVFSMFSALNTFAQNVNKSDSLVSDEIDLQEVVVSEKLIKREADKFIVDAIRLRKGKTDLLDLLSNVPGILVTDNDIRIPGRDGVRVMFNGRMKTIPEGELINILKSHRASNVAKIEVITSPGAKYDAGSDFGIINIITERGADYIGGEVGDDVTYADKWSNAARMNLNYQRKRVTASLNASWNYGSVAYTESNVKYFTDMTRKSHTDMGWRNNNYNISGSLDFMIDSLSTVGIEAYYIDTYRNYPSTTFENTYDMAGVMTEESRSPSLELRDGRNMNLNFYIDRNWSSTNRISFIMDLFKFDNDRDYSFNSYYYENSVQTDSVDYLRNQVGAHLKGLSFALDYSTLLPWNIKLYAGIKTSLTETRNSSLYDYSTLPVQNDDFTYSEDIYAGYLSLNKSLGHFDMVLGGRYELTHTKSENGNGTLATDNYGRLFPTVNVMYRSGDGSTFGVSVFSGIRRPGIQVVNPFTAYLSANSTAQGNPTIKPNYWYGVRLSNNIVLCSGLELGLELRAAKEFDCIGQVTQMNAADGSSNTQWQNAYDKEGCGVDLSLYFTKLSWLRAYIFGELFYCKTTADSRYSLSNEHVLKAFAMGDLRFIFDRRRNLTGYVTATYSGKDKNVVQTIDSRFSMSCGIAYSCLKGRLNMKLGVSNLFAGNVKGVSISNNGMSMHFNNDYSPLSVTLGFSYSFGKEIRSKRKTYSNSDIKSRF